jgi:hypothetical protein
MIVQKNAKPSRAWPVNKGELRLIPYEFNLQDPGRKKQEENRRSGKGLRHDAIDFILAVFLVKQMEESQVELY